MFRNSSSLSENLIAEYLGKGHLGGERAPLRTEGTEGILVQILVHDIRVVETMDRSHGSVSAGTAEGVQR